MWRYLRDPTFSRFDTIPECDGHTHTHTHTHTQKERQTDRQTDTRRRHIPHLARRRAVKMFEMFLLRRNVVAGVVLHQAGLYVFYNYTIDDMYYQ